MPDIGLPTVRLGEERDELQALFAPGAAMVCCSLRHRGTELLAQNEGLEAYARRGRTMGIPLLYPWANRLAGFAYTVAGRTVEVPRDTARVSVENHGLPIHGVIPARQAWELVSAPGPHNRSLTARLSWNGSQQAEFAVFPFQHDLEYRASVGGARLEVEVLVHASGEDSVPVAFGFHPYLSPPGLQREQWLIELPAMRKLALDEEQIPVLPGAELPAERFLLAERTFDDGFVALEQTSRFGVAAAGRRIALEFIRGYPCAQVFAPREGKFICFEPMTAPANALSSHDRLRVLEPGERYSAAFVLEVEEEPPD